MRPRRPARSAVVVCALLLAASCSHDSNESQNAAMARMGLTLQQQNELFGIAADPATIVIDTTNPNAPKDPNTGKFIGTSTIRATLKDTAGAPRPGVEVVFSTDAGTLASAGAPVVTNDQGIAQDTLTVDQDAVSPVHVTATSGEEHATVEVPVSVIVPNQPPVAVAGDDRTVECSAQAGTPVAVDGSASTDPDSTPGTNDDIVTFEWLVNGAVVATGAKASVTLQQGTTIVTLRVTDKGGATATDDVSITVADTTPPALVLTPHPSRLWPPNHTMRDIDIQVELVDACSPPASTPPVVQLVSVSSNEPENGLGDGNTEPDIEGADIGTDDHHLRLRAERSGGGSGRVYTLVYSVTDSAGMASESTTHVRVPHDQGH